MVITSQVDKLKPAQARTVLRPCTLRSVQNLWPLIHHGKNHIYEATQTGTRASLVNLLSLRHNEVDPCAKNILLLFCGKQKIIKIVDADSWQITGCMCVCV